MMKQLTANTITGYFYSVWVSPVSGVIMNSVQRLPALSAAGINTPNYNSLTTHCGCLFSHTAMFLDGINVHLFSGGMQLLYVVVMFMLFVFVFFPRNQRLSDAGKSVEIMTTSVKTIISKSFRNCL